MIYKAFALIMRNEAGTVRCHLERRAKPEVETRRATACGRISDGERDMQPTADDIQGFRLDAYRF
ncbi:MAG: hypothetical protein IJE25_05100 [Clostridia bacterium]|nr:hypothetical protein [Clostridia bacterium]